MERDIGAYWLARSRPGSDAWAFANMRPGDRKQVDALCWEKARFDPFGALMCWRDGDRGCEGRCLLEYLCDLAACFLLVPFIPTDANDAMAASDYRVPEWTVRFRRAAPKIEFVDVGAPPIGLAELACVCEVADVELAPINAQGMTLKTSNGYKVILKSHGSSDLTPSQRFTFAHECAHILMREGRLLRPTGLTRRRTCL